MLLVVTSLSTGHRTLLRGKEKHCSINVFKVSTKKTSKTIFQHEIYGTVLKLFHKSHITARWQ